MKTFEQILREEFKLTEPIDAYYYSVTEMKIAIYKWLVEHRQNEAYINTDTPITTAFTNGFDAAFAELILSLNNNKTEGKQ